MGRFKRRDMAAKRKIKKQESLLVTIIFIVIVMGVFILTDLAEDNEGVTEIPQGEMTVSFIDIDQGNATLIQLGGVNTLIDTGKEKAYGDLSAYLDNAGVRTIDNFIITHPDSDHMGGADLIIKDYDVKNFYITYYTSTTNEYKEMLREFYAKNLPLNNLYEGDLVEVGEAATCQVLSPAKGAYYDDSNSASVVMMLAFGKERFLLTGDIPSKVEGDIRDKYDIDVDVLQVAHHGSDGSNGVLFLKNASPEYAVISVGEDNSYGHPRKNILNRLNEYAGLTLRTDLNGDIVFKTDGHTINYTVERGEAAGGEADSAA